MQRKQGCSIKEGSSRHHVPPTPHFFVFVFFSFFFPQNRTKSTASYKTSSVPNCFFWGVRFREKKKKKSSLKVRECARGRERGRKRAEEAGDGSPVAAAGRGAHGGPVRAGGGGQRGSTGAGAASVRRTKAPGPEQGRQSRQPGRGREAALPSSISSSQKPSPAKRASRVRLSLVLHVPHCSVSPRGRTAAPSASRAALRPPKRPAAGRRPISSSFRIHRKEIVLLKMGQKQFGNVVNGWEAQPVLPARRESRL